MGRAGDDRMPFLDTIVLLHIVVAGKHIKVCVASGKRIIMTEEAGGERALKLEGETLVIRTLHVLHICVQNHECPLNIPCEGIRVNRLRQHDTL